MSMVTLRNEINNHNIPEDTIVRILSKSFNYSAYPFAEGGVKEAMDEMHEKTMTLKEFEKKYPSFANDFEWTYKNGQFDHVAMYDMGYFSIWCKLIVQN